MALYFLPHDAARFHEQIRPALAASWRLRSFAPCQALCRGLAPLALAYRERYNTGPDEPLLCQVARGVTFHRDFWRFLAGEVLLYAAAEVPELQTLPETLTCLLAPGAPPRRDRPRPQLPPVQQAHYGSHDLTFGTAVYRPDWAGYNDVTDVDRLAAYLDGVRPTEWRAEQLAALPELGDAEERVEEVEMAREWFPALQEVYRRGRAGRLVVVCEVLGEG